MGIDYRVISIGTLAAHPLWGEAHNVELRTGHATTTLISAGGAHILVDPSLPARALLARIGERSPVRADRITHVFLTSVNTLHCRALAAFEGADWLAHDAELRFAHASLEEQATRAREAGDVDVAGALEHQLRLVRRCRTAPDRLAPGVDLFPLPGVTAGCCGLLISLPRLTVLVCGDAVATAEHLEQGKVLPECHDVEQARESFNEAIQIADLLIPGRDNVTINPVPKPLSM